MVASNHDRHGAVAAFACTAMLVAGLTACAASTRTTTLPPAVSAGTAEAQEPAPASSWDVAAASQDEAAAAPAAPSTPESATSGPQASHLTAIEGRSSQDGTLLILRADGRIEGAQSFTLLDPERLVIDIPGLVNTAPMSRLDVDAPHAARVRVGQHADKVRVVVDAGSAPTPFEGRMLEPKADGMMVMLGSGALALAEGEPREIAQSDAVPPSRFAEDSQAPIAAEPTPQAEAAPVVAAAEPQPEPSAPAQEIAQPEPAAEPTPAAIESEPAPATRVSGVQFDTQADRDRVVIVNEGSVDYRLMRPDGETLVVSLLGATIDPDAAVRIAPDAGGPVSLVTAFQQPEATTPEVRVVIRRASGLEPKLSQEGSFLFLDFPRSGATASAIPMQSAPAAMPTGASTAAEKAIAAATAPSAPPAAIEPGLAVDVLREGGLVDGKEYTGRRISLDFKDVDINDVLRLIAEVSDLNVIAGDDVKGNVTIRLVDVPWDQALDVILLTKGLGFVRVGSVLRIAPSDHLKAEEEARLQERRAKEKLQDLAVKLQPVNYANVDEVSKMVKKILTARGSVNVDKRTNTIILKDIPNVIDEATALIKAIDTQTPQVLIEAKVVEANLDFSRELGSQWGLGSQPEDDDTSFNVGGQKPLTNKDDGWPYEQSNNVVFSNPITSSATGLLNLGAFLLDDRFNVSLQLQAAESNGEGKVISSPRVVTLDNREAKIEQGVSIPFQTFENGDAQLEFIDAVLSLNVTPHITADKSIIMKIEVTRNAPDGSVPTPTGSPAIAKNQAKTETLVKDGQTLVIGGIYVVDKKDRESRVPYLHKVPLLGNAFKNRRISDTRKELLIFVTPRVVEGQEVAG